MLIYFNLRCLFFYFAVVQLRKKERWRERMMERILSLFVTYLSNIKYIYIFIIIITK